MILSIKLNHFTECYKCYQQRELLELICCCNWIQQLFCCFDAEKCLGSFFLIFRSFFLLELPLKISNEDSDFKWSSSPSLSWECSLDSFSRPFAILWTVGRSHLNHVPIWIIFRRRFNDSTRNIKHEMISRATSKRNSNWFGDWSLASQFFSLTSACNSPVFTH